MSGFTIPNTPDSFNQNQAEPDSLDFQILGNQKSGVVSGMAVAPGSSAQTVAVTAGEVLVNGAYYTYAGGTVLLNAYTSPAFFDIIHARLTGSTVTCYAVRSSTGGTNPRFPSSGTGTNDVNLDSTDVVLAAVWRVDSGIPVAQTITDKRIFVRSSTARTLTDTVSANRGSTADTYVNTAWTPGTTTASPFSVKVGSTWYNLSYWTANSNVSTTGTITAGAFVGNASSASSTPYSGLTGTIPTWNQNTTGHAATATLAAKASTLSQGGGNGTAMTFNWSGQGGQPTWLWGGSDGSNHYVYNPSNFRVSNANTVADFNVHGGRNNEANKIVRTDGNGYLQTGYINANGSPYDEYNNSSPDRIWGSNAGGDAYLRTYRTSALNVNSAAGLSSGPISVVNNGNFWTFYGPIDVATLFATNIEVNKIGSYTQETGAGTPLILVDNGAIRKQGSKRELKNSIEDVETGLSTILQLRPRYFKWNEKADDSSLTKELRETFRDIGFIAEEVNEVSGELVFLEKNKLGELVPGMWKNDSVVALLVKAVQELSAKVEALEAQ